MLEPGEIYFEDFSAILVLPDTTPKTYDFKKQDGRLKMCSKSLVFDPKDINNPLIKIPLRECLVLEQWKGSAKFITGKNVLSVQCKQFSQMLEGNIIAPYTFCEDGNFLFILNYANIMDCLPQICQLHRASTLHSVEQADMIATIVHSRQARVHFDPLWLDLYESVVMESQADKVNPLVLNPGRILLSTSRLFFQPYNNIENQPVIKIDLDAISKIMKRRFLLRHVGLEIFTNDSNSNPHIYLSFANQKERDRLYDNMLKQELLKLPDIDQDVMTLQWQNGVLSNYDYLLYLNSLGDRTFNDLTQYPVFPWIISDYNSPTLDLTDPKIYRDLSKPIGALNPDRLERLLERCEDMGDPKFIYGSHYSTPGFVLFYLVRLYPHYMLCLQNGRFDHPDRMFNSMSDVYKNCLNNMADFKELIPEFYDTETKGRFLRNNMGINFGFRFNGAKVDGVELPQWAESPEEFVGILRNALESEAVSKKLHLWIDLIFGYKQNGLDANKANNLFYHLCYEGNVNLDAINDLNERHALEVQIMEFGQIPKQVFKVPHPQRKIKREILPTPEQITNNGNGDDKSVESSKYLTISSVELQASFSSHKDTVSCVHIMDQFNILSVGHDSKLKVFSLEQNRQIRSVNIGNMPLSSCIKLPALNTIVIGSMGNEIILYDMQFGRITQTVTAHEDAIRCLLWGEKCKLLCSGSGDSTIQIWRGFNEDGAIKPIQCLLGQLDHNSQVLSCCFDTDNNHLAVGTEDGEIYIWSMLNYSIAKKLTYHDGGVTALSYTNDGQKIISCGRDCCFQITDTETGMVLFRKRMDSPILSMKQNDNLVIFGCDSGLLYIWDILLVKMIFQLKCHEGKITSVDISRNNEIIVTGSSDQTVKIWKPIF